MKGILTLIKLSRRTLDELRRGLSALENEKEQLQKLQAALRDELRQEMETAGKQPEMAHFFGDYAKRIQGRQDKILQEIRAVEKQMEKMAEAISAAFTEVKKYEIARDNELARVREETERREAAELDEVGSQMHHRRQQEEN